MVDRLTTAQRRLNMARIRGVDTTPERILRSALHRAGFRFRLHLRDLPGRPDLVLRRYSAVVFVHGCFWHRHPECLYATAPKTKAQFWADKLDSNRERDARQVKSLLQRGWRVLVVWECSLRKAAEREAVAARAISWIRGKSTFAEIPTRPRR
jgi:DNA mismatch endonuclease (patch repair protein)